MSFTWNGDEAARRTFVGAARGLSRAGRALLAESQTRVPWDTGDLSQSGNVQDATPADLVTVVSYSATSEDGFDYGVAVHEGLDMDFKTDHNPNAQAKFLEGPAEEMESELMGIVAMDIKREVG